MHHYNLQDSYNLHQRMDFEDIYDYANAHKNGLIKRQQEEQKKNVDIQIIQKNLKNYFYNLPPEISLIKAKKLLTKKNNYNIIFLTQSKARNIYKKELTKVGKAEIQMRIEQLRGEIQNLNANKNLYQNMNDKIGEAMDKLRSAKEHTDSAEKLLVKYYQSEVAGKKAADLDPIEAIRYE